MIRKIPRFSNSNFYEPNPSLDKTWAPAFRRHRINGLGDGEGAPGLLEVALLALEPTLVTGLKLHGVEGAIGHGGRDELVAATLVTVGGAGEHLVVVVGLALVALGENVKDGGGGHLVGRRKPPSERSRRSRPAGRGGADLLKVGLGGAKVLNLGLAALLDEDGDVAHRVEVVLEVRILAGERTLLGGVVLGGEEEGVAVTG